MSEWIEKKKAEVLSLPVNLQVLAESLATDRRIKRKYYLNKHITIDEIAFEPSIPQIAVWRGDITTLEIDCIVNSANEGLLGGGGIDEAIHGAAGPMLQRECAALPLCLPGNAVITKGYKLPAEKVIHAVGPYFDEEGQPQPEVLRETYKSIFRLVDENKIESIAFCPISTGFYGHPKEMAAEISMSTALDWLNSKSEERRNRIKIIFCAFDNPNLGAYKAALAKLVQARS